MIDLMGSGDAHEGLEDDKFLVEISNEAGHQGDDMAPLSVWAPLGVWDDEDDEDDEMNGGKNADVDTRLPKVLKAFQILKEIFDGKFKQMWA
jgi:hypothetical protein